MVLLQEYVMLNVYTRLVLYKFKTVTTIFMIFFQLKA